MADAVDREAKVLDRIEAYRRRRPRLTDEVVTMAHGAGGKASAALVDAVFVEAFARGEPGPLGDAATLALPTGERLAFTTDSFVVQPLRFPGGSIGHLAVHGTVNDLAVSGARPEWLSAAFVIEEGFPVDELRTIVADMADCRGSSRRRHRHRRHQGGGPRRRRRPVHHHGRRRRGAPRSPTGAGDRAGRRRRAGVGQHRRARHGGDARPRRPDARGRHPLRHRARQRARRGPVLGRALAFAGCATRPAAASARCATSWPATPAWPWFWTRLVCRWRRR